VEEELGTGVLASALEADADAHDAGRYDAVGERYDDILGEVLPFWDSHPRALSMGFHFWDCWVDARNHDWQYHPDADEADWPRLARAVAAALRSGQDPDGVPLALLAPGPTMRQRFLAWLRRGRPVP
jgi:hypothetical protein